MTLQPLERVATQPRRWHPCAVTWVVQREIALAGNGTLLDPDPSVDQPGEVALDGAGSPIPLVTRVSGQVWGDVVVVDAAGVPQPVGNEKFDLAFVKRTTSEVVPTSGTPTRQFVWNRGAVAADQAPGVQQAQFEMEAPAAVVLVVLDGKFIPGSGRLLVRIWEGAR